ncbi:MAG: TetR/AcrR family transcriptional regulator [Clostridiales bacterium]|nr:TetR/AcrR family transcriptional regulator [Clostridiales bacterium]
MTRKEQKEERRNAILMTGLTLFVKRGYYETKISDIASAVPMSTGLLFHYFESKEELLIELVKMGAAATKSTEKMADIPPTAFFESFLTRLFEYSKEQPWVFNMFVLMGQARRTGMPEEARKIALSASGVPETAKMIEKGQKEGVFRKGDPELLATCFWATVQGIMEEMALNENMQAPDPRWIVALLKE